MTASSRIQNLLSKKRLLPNVNTAPESAAKQSKIYDLNAKCDTPLNNDLSVVQQLWKSFNLTTKGNWKDKQTWHILVVRRHLGFYEKYLVSNQRVSCVTPAKKNSYSSGTLASFRDTSVYKPVTKTWIKMASNQLFRSCFRICSSISGAMKGREPLNGHCRIIAALSSKRHCSTR